MPYFKKCPVHFPPRSSELFGYADMDDITAQLKKVQRIHIPDALGPLLLSSYAI